MTAKTSLDVISERRQGAPVPIEYGFTAAGATALAAAGPSCPRWKRSRPDAPVRPCLLDAGHDGRCDPGGTSTARIRPAHQSG